MRAVLPLLASVASLLVLWRAQTEGPDLGGLMLSVGLALVGLLLGWRATLPHRAPGEDAAAPVSAADRLVGLAAVAVGGLSLALHVAPYLLRVSRRT